MDSMLHTLSIAQAHEKLQKKEISCTELTKACIDRAESVDKKLNALVYRNFERALEEAKKIDAEGEFTHLLTGIPFVVKDNFCEKDIPSTGCSNVLRKKDYRPPFESTATARVKAVGAISLGKGNTDEFTMGASTETSCYGVTRNPWDPSRVAGGSSGGCAAAVGADECLFALGSDTGGSIRQPAGFCGCSGLRATYGRVSRYGVMSMASSLDTVGPICKSVEDIAIVLSTIAGKDPLDGTTGDVPVPDYTKALHGDVKGLKIGLPKEYFIDGMDEQVEKAVRDAATQFEKMGAVVTDISLPHTEYAVATYYVIVPSEVSSNMSRYDGIRYGHTTDAATDLIDYYHLARTEGFGDEVKRRIMIGTYALSAGYYDAYYRKAQKVRTLIRKDFDDAFQNVDVILTPTYPTPAFIVGALEGDPIAMYLQDIFLVSQGLSGMPGMTVPCGFTSQNTLPIGLHLTGPQWGEDTILNAAYAYEQAMDWKEQKPNL
ncbi:Asp-tRNA(Asn)/Glu-tRNA(Gln) amidotransferase GatCAB subunit A [Candidatus Peregrinibacteria bacterium CG10_big_fil_rev_8_21_14_0_10_49_10]|nr:MAG: Asp-tRNA(Asn)/Glu-tRNA(Gln) amidotransferase GatCAB subunit A [Candidatus Peregrinibacteria bacterium CG10_big_fil_rev_8_21_14_0_10_49_10]